MFSIGWSVFSLSDNSAHCTAYQVTTSVLQAISASIVQGSAVGPASYVVNASDQKAVTASNVLCKYVDDTYAIIPSDNVHTRTAELDNVKAWTNVNNLRLNLAKCAKIISTTAGENDNQYNLQLCLMFLELSH